MPLDTNILIQTAPAQAALHRRSSLALHENEYRVDGELVSRLLADQIPEWSSLPLERVESSGTVNVVYRLGDDMLVRLPRTRDFSSGPKHEARWMPLFESIEPLRVPRYLALGRPSMEYPSHWSVLEWIDGTTSNSTTLADLHQAATTLGEFVVALRQIPTDGAPRGGNYRGFGLSRVDSDLRGWAYRLPNDIDRDRVLDVWESCLLADEWGGPPTWFHSDLKGDNLIASAGKLVAVIDWEGCTAADPCADYLAAWWLFDGESRETFRSACDAEQSDWQRGKGWALHMAVVAIPYYGESNPGFANQARRALCEILQNE